MARSSFKIIEKDWMRTSLSPTWSAIKQPDRAGGGTRRERSNNNRRCAGKIVARPVERPHGPAEACTSTAPSAEFRKRSDVEDGGRENAQVAVARSCTLVRTVVSRISYYYGLIFLWIVLNIMSTRNPMLLLWWLFERNGDASQFWKVPRGRDQRA